MKRKEKIKNKKLMLVLVVATLLLVVAGVSYAYFSMSGVSDKTISFKAGACLNITITEETDAISLENVYPSTVEQGLNNTPYTFHIENMCPSEANYQISLESLNQQANTLESQFLQASLELENGRRITNKLSEYDSITPTVENAYESRRLLSGTLQANETTYFSLRMWMDYDTLKEEGMNKIHSSKIVVSALNEKREDLDFFAITYTDETKEEGNNNWYKNYTTRVNITDTKSTNIKAKYCVGTTECIPNTEIELENNSYVHEYTNGTSILCTQAEDNLGNRSSIVCNKEVKIDTEAPEISYEIGSNTLGSNNWYKNLDLIVNANDNKSEVSSIKYCVTTSETCTPTETVNASTKTITLNTNLSNQKVCATSTDNNNNTSALVCSSSYNTDSTNPNKPTITNPTNGNWTNQSFSLTVTSSDNLSGISYYQYSYDNTNWTTYANSASNTFTTTPYSAERNQLAYIRAIDNAGNISESTSTMIKIDKTGPTINVASSSTTTSSITINMSGSDNLSGISSYYYSIDGGGYVSGGTSKTYSSLGAGTSHTIKIYALDNAGNQSAVTTSTISTKIAGKDLILSKNTVDTSRASGSFNTTYKTSTAGKIFSAQDNDGTTYFFAGASPNNWVSFAGYYWRIIRINGDGSIRLIYNGTSTAQTGTTTQIDSGKFNERYTDNAYIGFMYGNNSASTYEKTHANSSSSTIKTTLDNWYSSNLKTNYGGYIDTNAGFCGDRVIDKNAYSNEGFTGDGYKNFASAYAPLGRVVDAGSNKSTQTATFKCTNTNDLYTLSTSNKGNKALTNPIGLITSDEIVYAGGFSGTSNTNYWLYTNQYYWTMSPGYFNGGYAINMLVDRNGYLYNDKVNYSYGIRPVINLKADALSAGSGTTSDPYRIS